MIFDEPPSAADLSMDGPDLVVDFSVLGKPQPAGSKRHVGKGRIIDDNPHAADWKGAVGIAALDYLAGLTGATEHDEQPLWLDGPLGLVCVFTFGRPKSHFRSGRFAGQLKTGAPRAPTVKPDTTKLVRAVEDALTGIVWRDDAQVIEQSACKRYGSPPGARVVIYRAPAPLAEL